MEVDIKEQNKSKVALDKRCCYFLIFLVIALPVIVGVVVWKITETNCSNGSSGLGQGSPIVGDGETTTVSGQSTTVIPADEPWRNLRLPNYIVPIHYDITLYPDFYDDHGWFYGNETVEIEIKQTTNVILIHTNFLNITRTQLAYADGTNIPLSETFWYEENQFWVIKSQEPVAVSTVNLDLQFDGSLTRAIVGFYKSSYVNSKTGITSHLASSKFQPVDARRAFPCFDEPNIKAEYTITLIHRPNYVALSNMPVTSSVQWSVDSSLMSTSFGRSVKMSTYLVCFVVSDFANLTDTTAHGTEIRVFATPDRIQQASYSLHVMKVSMDLFEQLFSVPFPLPKNDMIAIPNFVSGAMEHWGLITYREVNMLYDGREASAANKQRVAVVVAHEIAHMWFGNIVTMDWWDDLWLNEGFASFVEYLGVQEAEPDWAMLDQMVVDDIQPVMVTDAGVNSHPIVVEVSHPDQINEVFDAISYSKGASVIRMLQEIMGSTSFFAGIAKYLVKYEWGTATTDNLWTELETVPGGYSVKEVMDTWTRQMGLPYINITFSETNGQLSKVSATQKRFLADRTMSYDETESPFRYRWFVQLDYMDGTGHQRNWLTKDDDTKDFDISMDMTVPGNLIKFNVNQTGFYRVNYPDFIWQRFASRLHTTGPSEIPNPADRSGLVDDAFNLARGGYLSYDVALEMTKYLNQDMHHLPWDSAYSEIIYLSRMFENSGKFDSLSKYFAMKVRPVLQHLTWEDSPSHLDNLMRANIIRLACDFGDPDCLRTATAKLRGWIDNGTFISPNVRTYVYKYGMQEDGSEADWNFMWNKYTTETVPQEQVKLLYGLANTKHIWLLNRYFEYAKDSSKVKSQDFFTVISYIASTPIGRNLAWDWVRMNWEYLVNRFSLGSRSLGRLTPTIVQYFNTQFKLQEVEAFWTKYPDAGAGARGRDQARESIQRNIAWMNNYSEQIDEWLRRQI